MLPRSVEQVAEVVKLCQRHGVPVIARGAGTSLAGGCLPVARAGTNGCSHGNGAPGPTTSRRRRRGHADADERILEIDLRNRMAVVEAGVSNLRLTQALGGTGFHFAPDPSSQGACTIGGNVATNAGGPHTLKYGVTVNHVLGLECVLADGSIVQLGPVRGSGRPRSDRRTGRQRGHAGHRHQGLGPPDAQSARVSGDAGDLRLGRRRHQRDQRDHRRRHHSRGPGDDGPGDPGGGRRGVPFRLSARCRRGAGHRGRWPGGGLDRQQEQIVEFCRRFGAREVLQAASAQERELLWKCRKMAVGAIGRLSPSYTTRTAWCRGPGCRTSSPHGRNRPRNTTSASSTSPMPATATSIRSCCSTSATGSRWSGPWPPATRSCEECIACGGSVTGEHGIGVEKIGLMDRLFAPGRSRGHAAGSSGIRSHGAVESGKVDSGRGGD